MLLLIIVLNFGLCGFTQLSKYMHQDIMTKFSVSCEVWCEFSLDALRIKARCGTDVGCVFFILQTQLFSHRLISMHINRSSRWWCTCCQFCGSPVCYLLLLA